MLLVVVGLVICLLVGGILYSWTDLEFLPLIIGITVACVTCFYINEQGLNRQAYIHEETQEILALNTGTTVDGEIGFLGTGYVSGDMVYYYSVKDSDGFIVDKHIKVGNARKKETKGTPRIVATQKRYKAKGLDRFTYVYPDSEPTSYEIYVPEGSIILDYNASLPK